MNNALTNKHKKQLGTLLKKIQKLSNYIIGYPCNQNFDYTELYQFLKYPINNIGDPFVSSSFHMNSHKLEQEVIHFFANITNAKKDFWGYVTNGGTEGNMYGLYLARELYPEGIVYYSQDTHYSVTKILRVLNMKNIMIRSLDNGEIDYEDLTETIKLKRDVPPIIIANIGTTMKGAIDNVPKINDIIRKLAIRNYYVHSDAALNGMMLPFINGAPPFDFSAGVGSISISGHKFIGAPIPCGVVLAKKSNVDTIARSIEYVGTLDTTISGSRNGITPLFLWYAIKCLGVDGLTKMVKDCLTVADYALEKFKEINWNAWKNEHSTTVVFNRPSKELIKKWQLAPYKDIAHIVVLPHVTKKWIDRFIKDFKEMECK